MKAKAEEVAPVSTADDNVTKLRNTLLRRVRQQEIALEKLNKPWADDLTARRVQQCHMQITKRLYKPGFETDTIVEFQFNEAAHMLDKLRAIPAVLHGQRFKRAREKDDFGPVRKAIDKVLEKRSNMWPREVHAVFKAKPPRGWTVYEWKGLKNLLIDYPGGSIDRKNFTNRVGDAKKAARRK